MFYINKDDTIRMMCVQSTSYDFLCVLPKILHLQFYIHLSIIIVIYLFSYMNEKLAGKPGDAKGKRERTKLLGETIQPRGGGGFKPVMQLMDRADPNDGATGRSEMFAATRGPCLTGGCAKLCSNFEFGSAVASPQDEGNVKKLHSLNFGDFATITKLKPKTMAQGAREMFTDSDLYDVRYKNPSITPQQKANVLAQMVHLDYMFFERDGDMCYSDGSGFHIVLFNCFIYGCVCPCEIVLSGN